MKTISGLTSEPLQKVKLVASILNPIETQDSNSQQEDSQVLFLELQAYRKNSRQAAWALPQELERFTAPSIDSLNDRCLPCRPTPCEVLQRGSSSRVSFFGAIACWIENLGSDKSSFKAGVENWPEAIQADRLLSVEGTVKEL